MVSAHRFNAIRYRVGGNEVLSIVLVSDPDGEYPDIVLFDTDTTASDLDTIKRYGRRWSIEITNRETRRLLGSADPQCRTENSVQRAPLMAYWSYCLAVRAGHAKVVRLLPDRGADPNAVGCLGLSPLTWAVAMNHLNIAHWLVERGADVNATNAPG